MIQAAPIATVLLLIMWGIVAYARHRPTRRPSEVYVAAPFAPLPGLSSADNTARAVAVGRRYTAKGLKVCCVPPGILAGRYGDDTDPRQRARGMRRTLRLCEDVARNGGILAVLRAPDGSLSAGTALELARFEAARRAHLDARVEFWTWDDAAGRPVREK